jgi:small subunit ribosomal protein S16
VAVKIRLKRLGKIRAPYYRIVVADSRTKRDGRVIEEIGKYHPTEDPSFIEVKSDRAQYWLGVGAQPSPQVEAILKLTGDWGIFKGDKNAKSTVKTKEAPVVFQADEKKKPVLKPKVEKIAPVVEVVEAPVAEVAAAPAAEIVEAAAEPVVEAAAEPVVEAAAEPVDEPAPAASAHGSAGPVVGEAPVADEAVVAENAADASVDDAVAEADKA